MFRKFDSYCPEHYRCQGYDLDAEWFDGESITELRYAIDLENGTMDRCVILQMSLIRLTDT